jgi:hypothetical protein
MRLVNARHAVKACMVTPDDRGYILLAAETGWRGPWLPTGAARRLLLAKVATRCEQLAGRPDVVEATVFTAIMVAPGEGTSLLEARAAKVHRARYDLVVLVRTPASTVPGGCATTRLPGAGTGRAGCGPHTSTRSPPATPSSSATFDHRPNHVFLFNYFYADDLSELIPVFGTPPAGSKQRPAWELNAAAAPGGRT